MRATIQRVTSASIVIDNEVFSQINKGLLILLGVENEDTQEDIDWLVGKTSKLRIFSDEDGLMNLSVKDIQGEVMVVSQFTLFASTKKGNRPSFIRSAKPETSKPLYDDFIQSISEEVEQSVATGVFGADMKITLENDGPVTINIDSKNRE